MPHIDIHRLVEIYLCYQIWRVCCIFIFRFNDLWWFHNSTLENCRGGAEVY